MILQLLLYYDLQVQAIFSLELTNPLLQLRWFLRTAGYNNTPIHTAVELLFVVLFLVMRLVFGSVLTYTSLTSSKVKVDIKICITFLYLVSLAFIFYIFQFIKKKYSTKKDKSSEQFLGWCVTLFYKLCKTKLLLLCLMNCLLTQYGIDVQFLIGL